MIDTAIGLSTGKNRLRGHNELQLWMAENGLKPYLPQLSELSSYNIALYYDVASKTMNWPPAAIAATAMFEGPMIFHYNSYHYAKNPRAMKWGTKTQDELDVETMSAYLLNTRLWFESVNVKRGWMMIDEPPPEKSERWSLPVDDRITKFIMSSLYAGWKVGIALPHPSAFAYWADKFDLFKGVRWILNAKHPYESYRKTMSLVSSNEPEFWLYNKRDTFNGLASQIRQMKASGYLHFSAEWEENKLADVTDDGYVILQPMHSLINELKSVGKVTLENLDTRLRTVETAVFGRS